MLMGGTRITSVDSDKLMTYSGEGHGKPLQYSCLENPYGQRSLVEYKPWGCKDTTD